MLGVAATQRVQPWYSFPWLKTAVRSLAAVHRLVRCGARSAPMGIPVTRECALPGCEMLSTSIRAKDGGVYFDVSVLFAPREARKPPVGELWACCAAHKAAALREVLKEMPFLSIAQQAGRACEVSDQLLAEA